jgi:D-3-phosphoglycerate dehydrogenase
LPLDAATRGLYGRETLARLRADCVLLNTARGGIVDQDALKDVLRAGRIAAACSDVLVDELQPDRELLGLPNFFGTPHIGASAEETRLAMGRVAIEGLHRNRVP